MQPIYYICPSFEQPERVTHINNLCAYNYYINTSNDLAHSRYETRCIDARCRISDGWSLQLAAWWLCSCGGQQKAPYQRRKQQFPWYRRLQSRNSKFCPRPHAAENSIRDLRPSLVPSLPGSTCVNHFTTLRHPADNSNHHHHLTPTRPTDFLLSITAITAHSGHAPEVHFSHPETPESSIKQQYRLLPWLRRYAHSLAVSCFHLLWRYIIIFRFFFLLY